MGKPEINKRLNNLKPPFKKGNKIAEKPFDIRQFEALCRIHCTEKEICDILGYKDHKTLNSKLTAEYGKPFEEVYPEFASQGKASLRRLQWKRAEQGSDSMLKWLGQQLLGQSDKQEIESNSNNKIEIIREIYHREAPKKED